MSYSGSQAVRRFGSEITARATDASLDGRMDRQLHKPRHGLGVIGAAAVGMTGLKQPPIQRVAGALTRRLPRALQGPSREGSPQPWKPCCTL
jgi:hypothetical protein